MKPLDKFRTRLEYGLTDNAAAALRVRIRTARSQQPERFGKIFIVCRLLFSMSSVINFYTAEPATDKVIYPVFQRSGIHLNSCRVGNRRKTACGAN